VQDDTLRAVLETVFRSSAYDWAPDRDPLAWLRHAWGAFLLWLREAHAGNPLGFRLVAAAALLVVLVLVGRAVWIFLKHVRPSTSGTLGPALAPTPVRDAPWWRKEARHLATAGQYRAAIKADFQALLLTLEGRDVLRVHASATPAEYARTARLSPAAREQLEETVRRLYGYLFARWPCGPEEYAAWQDATDPDRYAPTH
jgi:hypothetical protein